MELEAADAGQLSPSSRRRDTMRPLMTLALLALAVLCLAGQAGECPPLCPAEEEGAARGECLASPIALPQAQPRGPPAARGRRGPGREQG